MYANILSRRLRFLTRLHCTRSVPPCPGGSKKEQASSANSYFILQCLPLYDSQKRERETTVVIVAVGIYIFQTSFIVFYDGGKHEGRVQWAMTNRSS